MSLLLRWRLWAWERCNEARDLQLSHSARVIANALTHHVCVGGALQSLARVALEARQRRLGLTTSQRRHSTMHNRWARAREEVLLSTQ